MRIIKPSFELINPPSREQLYSSIELAGRVCYKSEDKITVGSAEQFIANVVRRGHEAVLEHGSITVKITCDRGVSHEIVRHRLASYCQESTRYCNYAKDKFGSEITVIKPSFLEEDEEAYRIWESAMWDLETSYFELLRLGVPPQGARAVLPNSLKTEVVMTANPREWRHFFKLRTSDKAHPQMREVATIALGMFQERWPILFEDI